MTRRWPLERVPFALAATMVALSVVLPASVSRWFLVLTAFVAVNRWPHLTGGGGPASPAFRRAGLEPRGRW